MGSGETVVKGWSPKMGPFIRATPSCEFERPQWFSRADLNPGALPMISFRNLFGGESFIKLGQGSRRCTGGLSR